MRRLFVKIFVSYWIAQLLFFVLAMLVTVALRPSREISDLQAQQAKFLDEVLQANRTGGEQATWRYLRSVHETYHVRLFVVDDSGNDVIGRKPPDWVERALHQNMRTADSFWGRLRPIQFLRASTTTADGHHYTLITELPPEPHFPFGVHGIPGLGILIGIISSGLVCYFLARYLTSPIARLRVATQQLASGDLSARAGMPGSRRRDETAELVRDFDRMAGRIQTLVTARQRSGADAASALDRIDRETTRLNEMIQRLLTLVRLEGGDDSLEKSPVHLRQVIQEIAKDAAFEAQSRHCHVQVEGPADCVVTCSLSLLHSAIENVVRNAIRYTEEGTSVIIQLDHAQGPSGSEAIIRVID